jgi:hypothetical protein
VPETAAKFVTLKQNRLHESTEERHFPSSNIFGALQAGMIGFITLQQSAPSQMTWSAAHICSISNMHVKFEFAMACISEEFIFILQ